MRYLERVGGVYRVRVRIPKDVKRHSSQAEIRKSLHTTRFSQAKMLMYNLLSETERIFTMIRSGVLSDDMIRKIVADYLDVRVSSFEQQRNGEGGVIEKIFNDNLSQCIETDTGLNETVELMGLMNDRSRKALSRRQVDYYGGNVRGAAIRYIADHNLNIAPGSVEFDKLCNELLKADIRAEGIILEHLQGNYETDYDRHERSKPKSKTLKELIEIYESEKMGSWQDPCSITATHKKILHILGDIKLNTIDRELCISFRNLLKEYPLKCGEYTTPWRVLAKKKKTRLSERTQHFTFSEFVTLMSYGNNNNMGVLGNPAKDLLVNKDDCKRVKVRVPYTPDELNRMLLLLAKVDRTKKPETFWIPLLLLYTGARANDICMLRCADVVGDGEDWFIHFRNDKEFQQRTKNEDDRQVPVHSALLKAGFIEYRNSQIRAGHDRLFTNLKLSKDGKWNRDYGKTFNLTFKLKFLPGYTKEQLGAKDLHTFCGTFISWFVKAGFACDMQGIATLQSIVGHSEIGEARFIQEMMQKAKLTIDGYGGGLDVDQKTFIEKLDYGIDLSILLK